MNAVNTTPAENNGSTQVEEPISFSDEQNHPVTGAEEEGTSEAATVDPRDEEMEDALAKELTGDALADYDIEVTKEGEAVKEYLALLESL